jgi:hypothetical protein
MGAEQPVAQKIRCLDTGHFPTRQGKLVAVAQVQCPVDMPMVALTADAHDGSLTACRP